MTKQETISAKTTWYSRLLGGSGTREAPYENEALILLDRSGQTPHRVAANDLQTAEINRGRFHNSTTLTTK